MKLSLPLLNKRMQIKLGVHNPQVLAIIMLFAFLIVAVRIFAPFEVGKDQAQQMEGAQRFVQHLGLTTSQTRIHPDDIMQSPRGLYLTWWPPGFSIILAGSLVIGLPLLASLKIIYATISLIGWFGWAIIASHLLLSPLGWKGKTYNINLLIAALLPIFYTPLWDGTDIFLWAGVPFIVLLTFRSKNERASYASIAVAGLLFGFLYAMRYASLFVPLAAILILLQGSFPNFRSFLKRAIVFLLSSLILILPTVAYVRAFSPAVSYMPAYVTLADNPERGATTIINILDTLIFMSNMLLGHPLLERIIADVLHLRFLIYISGVFCFLAVFLLPYVLLKNRPADVSRPQDDLALSVSFLPLSLTIFFCVSTYTLHWSPFGIERYYVPVLLSGILIFYQILASRPVRPVIKALSGAIVLSFFIYNCAYLPLRAFSPRKRHEIVLAVMGYTPPKIAGYPSTSYPIKYPDLILYSRKENSRSKLKELSEANPQAIFYVLENYQYYIYDRFQTGGPVPGENLRFFPRRDFWQQAYTSEPVKVFWVLDEPSASINISWINFVPESNLREIFYDSSEKTKIYVSEFPARYKFQAN